MNDKEKFEGFKEKLIQDNEEKYGKEVRQKYGDDIVNVSNAKVRGFRKETMQEAEALRQRMEIALAEAVALGDPAGELAQSVCEMHKQWLCIYWPEGMYSREAHKGLADMYVEDERFRANYERIAPGCTEFLQKAIHIFCEDEKYEF